jgi:hypothetical protein
VYYLDDVGYVRQVEDFLYDETTGLMSFTLPHLSLYLIAREITLPFTDVADENWFSEAVRFVYGNHLFNGTGETTFSPELTMNRAMFVSVLGRMAKAGVDPSAAADFSDVVVDGWSSGYIAWATDAGIIQGYGGGLFGQYDSITREQMAVILFNYAKWGASTSAIRIRRACTPSQTAELPLAGPWTPWPGRSTAASSTAATIP